VEGRAPDGRASQPAAAARPIPHPTGTGAAVARAAEAADAGDATTRDVIVERRVPEKGSSLAERRSVLEKALLECDPPMNVWFKEMKVIGAREREAYVYAFGLCRCGGTGQCPVTVTVKWNLDGPNAFWMVAKKKAVAHVVERAAPTGGALWNALEKRIIEAFVKGKSRIKTKELHTAFREAGVVPRASDAQIHDYVKNFNKTHKDPMDTREPLVQQLEQHVEPWCQTVAPTEESVPSVDTLFVLAYIRRPVVTKARVYVPFACRGSLSVLKSAKAKWLVIVWDAKKKVFCDSWGILSIGFLVRKTAPGNTSLRHAAGKRTSVELFTGTFQLFFQAIVHEEDETNATWALEDALALAQLEGVDLKKQVLQLHKDYAKGLESGRKTCSLRFAVWRITSTASKRSWDNCQVNSKPALPPRTQRQRRRPLALLRTPGSRAQQPAQSRPEALPRGSTQARSPRRSGGRNRRCIRKSTRSLCCEC